jgi:hypothetical protein
MGAGAVRNLMQPDVFGLSRPVVRLLAILALAAAVGQGAVGSVAAQPASTDGPPVAVGGWAYERGAADVHLFQCNATACAPGSRVSYRFYPPGTTMPVNQFRSEQEMIAKALQSRAPSGTKITILAIEGDDGTSLPRMYKARRLTIAPNGTKEYVHSGLLVGEHASVSLISSSFDEKAAEANYSTYGVALLLTIQKPTATQK